MNKAVRGACAALAIAIAGGGALAGTASASKEYESAQFKVVAKGTQKVTWSNNHTDAGACDVSYTGGGYENIKFQSKPIVVDAFLAPGEKRPVLTANDHLVNFTSAAKITRDSHIELGPGGPDDVDCPGGTGEETPPQSDCGTKAVDWRMDLGFDYVKKDELELSGMNTADPFKNCSASGDGFPYFTGTYSGDSGTMKTPKLPADELFDDSLGKIIVIGRGKSTIREPEFTSDGKVQWDVSFRRLKTKPTS